MVMTQSDEMVPKSDPEILRETKTALQDWHDHHHAITHMDACPWEPCSLLPIELTRYQP